MNTRLLYLLPQILPQILHRLSKNSFRENRFVFSDGPEAAAGKAAEAAEEKKAAREAEKDKDEKKEVVVATGKEGHAQAADSRAVDTVQPDPIDKELSALDQAKFDQLMEKVNKDSLERTMTPAQVETLITFAKTNEPQKNLQTLFTAISEAKITADQLNLNSVKIMVEHVQSDPAKFTKFFALLAVNTITAGYMLEATADKPDLLKEAYASIKNNQVIITNLSPEGLAVLVNKIDLTDLLGKLTVDQKAACLISQKVDDPKKELILENLVSAKANMSEYMTNVSEAIISYILEKSPKHLGTTLTQKLDEASIKKLSYKSAKELVEKTVNNKDLTALYANILKSIQAPTKKAIIDDKTAKLEARLALYNALTEEEKKHSFKPGEEPGAEKGGEKTGETKTETFTKDTDLKQRIEKAGLKLVKKGKSVGWDFDVLDKDGLMTTSERSFLKTKKFLKELNKTDDKGELVYNTPDKVRLCAYKWLWEQVYKGGKIKKPRGKVEEFEKSQERLQQEITRLEAAVSGKPAPAPEDKDKAKAGEPAPAPKDAAAAPTAPVGEAPKAAEPAPTAAQEQAAEIEPKMKAFIGLLEAAAKDFETKEVSAEITDAETKTDVALYFKLAADSIKKLSETYKKFPNSKIGDLTSPSEFPISQADITSSLKEGWDKDDSSKDKAKTDFTKTISDKLTQKAKDTAAEIAKEKPEERKKAAEYISILLTAFQNINKFKEIGGLKNAPAVLANSLAAISDKADRKVPRSPINQISKEYELFGAEYMKDYKDPTKAKETVKLVLVNDTMDKDEILPIIDTLLAKAFPEAGEDKPPAAVEPAAIKGDKAPTAAPAGDAKAAPAGDAKAAPAAAPVQKLSPEQVKEKLDGLKLKGLDMTGNPDSLTKEQAETLDTALASYTEALKTASDAFEIIAALKTIGRNFSKNFQKPTEIKLTDEKSKITLKWSASNNTSNNGFEETNPLIDKILEIKRSTLGGSDNPEYEEFFNQSRIARTEARKADAESQKIKEYSAKYKELTSRVYTLDYAIGDMSEEDIAKNWGHFENHRPVETIMGKPPFGISSLRAGEIASKMISEGRNDRIYFSDIFTFAKELPGFKAIVKEGKISAELLQNGDKLLSEYEKLVAQGKNEEANYIFEKIIAPSLKLIDAISRLRFEEKREGAVEEKDALEVAKKSLPENQKEIIASLQKLLNYSEDPAGAWEKFLGWSSGAEKITMANMDGTTFDVDKGMFSRHFDPKAALIILLEKPNLYTIKDGKKEINEPALLAEVNELMQRGYAIKEIQKAKAKTKGIISPAEIKAIQEGAKKFTISSLRNTTPTEDQMRAFQLGFLNKEIEESENTVEKGLENYLNSIFTDKPLSVGESKIFKEILKQGGPKDAKKLQEVRAKFAEVQQIIKAEAEKMKAGGKSTNIMHGHLQFDQKGNLQGGGIAVPIKLSDGATMTVALGAGELTPGQVVPIGAVGFSLKIAGGEGWNVNFNTVIAVSGAFAGVSGHHESDSGVDVDWMVGLSLSWWNIVDLGVGAGVGVSWDRAQLKSEREKGKGEAVKDTGWTKEDLEKWPKMSTEEKLAILKKSPEWANIKTVQAAFPDYLNDKTLARAYNSQISELKGTADSKAEKPFPGLVPVGFGFVAMAPALIALAAGNPPLALAIALIGGVKFRLGTVEIFIPHPKEEQRILELATDTSVRAKIAETFAKMKTGEEKVVFEEKTADVYYRPGSGLGKGIKIDSGETNFSGLHNDIGSYNEALEKGGTETRLVKHPDGKIELVLDNLFNKDKEADKDVEVHIDPNLLTLGVIQDGGRIFLEGKIDDLIITRERFRFSHTLGEGRSSIRDVITIRQSSSLSGKKKVDRAWLEENEQSYLEILMGKKKFKIEQGGGYIGVLQDNIRGIKGFATAPDWKKEGEPGSDFARHFHQFRPDEMKVGNEGKIIDKAKTDAMRKDVKEMHKALGAVAKEAFEKEQSRAGFNEKIRSLFIDPDFHEAYGEKFDSTDKPTSLGALTAWLKTYTDENPDFGLTGLTPKELALGENILRDLWFTTAYRCEGPISKLKLDKGLSAKLHKAKFKNIRNLDILTTTELKAACLKRKVTLTDDEAKTIVDAVQTFKEKPLSEKELIKKNQQLKKRIELVRDYSASKFVTEFERVIPSMKPPLENTNAKDLVNNYFIKDIYTDILTELDRKTTPPPIMDFRKLGMEDIPTGADLVSGTRFRIDGKRVKALSHTLFEKTDKSEAQLYSSGFLKDTTHEYSLTGKGEEKDIARILLELASPIPEGDKEFLKSSFAIKVLGLGAYRLIAGEKNYRLMIEVAQNPDKATDDSHKEAVAQFKELVLALRQHQHEGKPYTTKSAETGATITIDMASDTKIVSGAYTQCTNTSFYVSEKGKAKVTVKKRKVAGASAAVTSVADAETQLASVTYSLSGGVSLKKDETPPERDKTETPAAGGGGEVDVKQPATGAGGATDAPPQPPAGAGPTDI